MRSERLLWSGIAALFLLFAGILHSALRETAVLPGDTAPGFTARQFGAKLLAVNFWATWCAGCVAEIPSLNHMQTELGREGIAVLAISVDDDEPAYREFLARRPVVFRTMRSGGQEIEQKFGTVQIPETYLIDRNGRVVEKLVGAQIWDSAAMIGHLRSLL